MGQHEDAEKALELIKEQRKNIKAPVDTMGVTVVPSEVEEVRKYQILVKLILSIQTSDKITHRGLYHLDKELKGLTVEKVADMDVEELEEILKGVYFYKRKSTYIINASREIKKNPGVLNGITELSKLKGIGPKILSVYSLVGLHRFHEVPVDLHVHRILNRIGLVKTNKPETTQKELVKMNIKDRYLNYELVGFGQMICKSKPKCKECKANKYCLYAKNKPW